MEVERKMRFAMISISFVVAPADCVCVCVQFLQKSCTVYNILLGLVVTTVFINNIHKPVFLEVHTFISMLNFFLKNKEINTITFFLNFLIKNIDVLIFINYIVSHCVSL